MTLVQTHFGPVFSTRLVKSFFAYIQVSTQNVSQLWKRIYASSSFWDENGIYPEPSVLHEQPSDGLEIVVAVWGIIRATKNPILKISPQNFFKPVPRKMQTHETQLEFRISKTPYFSIYTSSNSKYSKHTLLQCFFELNLSWNAWKSPWMKEGNKMILFFWSWVSNQQRKNDFSVVFFSYEEEERIFKEIYFLHYRHLC